MSQTFADLGISPAVSGALADQGITEPFAVQSLVIGDVLAGHDVLVQSPTGSGKTLAFAAPMVDNVDSNARRPMRARARTDPRAGLPDRRADPALARASSITTMAVYGGVGIQPQIQKAKKTHFLVATPGRLLDLLDRGR